MSSFTKKDFTLVEDAIIDAVQKFIHSEYFGTILSGEKTFNPNHINLNAESFRNRLIMSMSIAFSEKLRYTNDSFDGEVFKQHLVETIKGKPLPLSK